MSHLNEYLKESSDKLQCEKISGSLVQCPLDRIFPLKVTTYYTFNTKLLQILETKITIKLNTFNLTIILNHDLKSSFYFTFLLATSWYS